MIMHPAIALGVCCPGAGIYAPAQSARLHADYAAARELLSRLAERVGDFLHQACVADSFEAINKISRNYPAIVASGLLAARAAEQELGRPLPAVVFGGYSLGHFTALALSGALDPVDAIALVAVRARLMHEAAVRRPGEMLLVSGVLAGELADLVEAGPRDAGPLVVACRNSTDSTALSGTGRAIAWARDRLRDRNVRVKRLSAGVAAHSPLMADAQDHFSACLQEVTFGAPHVPVLLNSTGEACADPERIKTELMTQLTTPVRWDLCRETIECLGVDAVVDVGPGTMMANFCTGIAPAIHLNAGEPLAVALGARLREGVSP